MYVKIMVQLDHLDQYHLFLRMLQLHLASINDIGDNVPVRYVNDTSKYVPLSKTESTM